MEYMLIAFVWVLNLGLSYWNAYAAGKAWVESKMAGGFVRFMVWMAATMSACGFSWCYLIFLALTAHHFQWIDNRALEAMLNLGYIILIPVILFAGYAITFDSWVQAYRNRDLPSMGVAAWNTYATIHNTYDAIESFGPALKSVTGFFGEAFSSSDSSDDDDKSALVLKAALVVIMLVALALAGGLLTTYALVKKYAGSDPVPDFKQELEDVRRQ